MQGAQGLANGVFIAMMRAFISGLGLAAMAGVCATAWADAPVERHRDWRVYVRNVDGDRICYAATDAVDRNPKGFEHGQVTAVVSSWRSGSAREQPSLVFGYDLRPTGPVRARVGRESWSLYAVQNEAFADDEDEPRLVRAMRKGAVMKVEAVTEDARRTVYEFSLSGATAALRDVQRRCG